MIYGVRVRIFTSCVTAAAAPILLAGCASTSLPNSSTSSVAPSAVSVSPPAQPSDAAEPASPSASASEYQPADVNAGAPYVGIDCLNGHVTPGKIAPPGPNLGGVWAQLRTDSAPGIVVREGAPQVSEVQTLDLVDGTGQVVKGTDTVVLDYCGVGLETRTAFDSSWVHGGAFPVPLQKVIPGWRDAISGMKIGGTRVMLVPAALGFGDKPPKGSGITPGETIAFVVTVRSVSP